MSFLGDIIGAVGNVLGGREASKEANDQQLFNYQAQKEFAQSGIRWRVEDAKAAGLHPLFALGGAGATFSPGAIVTPQGEAMARAGQDLGRAANAATTLVERQFMAAKLEESRAAARKDDAEASWWESAAARARQQGPSSFLDTIHDARPGMSTTWSVLGDPAGVGITTLPDRPDIGGMPLPAEAPTSWISGEKSKSAWDRYEVGPGLQMLLPAGSNMSEAIESVSESTMIGAGIVAMNARHYGPGWLDRFGRHFGWPQSKLDDIRKKLDRFEQETVMPSLLRGSRAASEAATEALRWYFNK